MKRQLLVLMVAALLGAGVVSGQSGVGTILGTVTDSTGGVVVNAKVEVTNTETNVTQKTETTSAGTYSAPYLRPGTYRVTVTMTGFEKSVVQGVTLTVDQENRVDLVLKTGAVTETVTVEASGVTLETDNASISQLVSEKQVTDLPLNGRNFQQLLFIGAGAVQTGGEQGSMRAGQGAAISINGSRPESNTYLIDGMLNTDQALNTPATALSIDAIQEFKVLSETYSAQYGFSANQISIVTKGGTNALHGSVFEFDRNDGFDAKNFFANPNAAAPELRQNQYGFVVGGPVYIPKLYDGRNKTFWFANYEGWRVRQGVQQFANVPPDPAVLQGFFTASITDPTTGLPFAGCTNGGTTYVSCVPQARFSRLANAAIGAGYFPAPNCAPAACAGNNYRLAGKLPSDTDQQTYRVDQQLGKFGTIFARGSYLDFTSANGIGTSSAQLGQTEFVGETTNWAITHTINFGPRTVNEFHFGRLNTTTNQTGVTAPESFVSAVGLTGVFSTLTPLQRIYPYLQFANNAGAGPTLTVAGGAVNAYSTSNNPMWQFGDTLTLNRGAHTWSLGVDYKRWLLNRDVANNFLGNYNFAGFATGNQFADFLLGYYSGAAAFVPGAFSNPKVAGNPRQYNFQYFAPFVQDDWKVTSRLTANLGVRWDLRTVPYETHNHMGWLDTSNPLGGMCIADKALTTDGIAPDGNGFYRYCGRRNPADAEKHDFAPRIGLAYRPFNKTVVRAGYGIFWDGIEGREIDGSADIYPYVSRLALAQTTGNITQTTDQLFPSFTSISPVTPAANSFIAVNISEKPQNPYMQQWTLSVQRELARNTTLEVNYVGNKGTHLLSRNNINQALPITDTAFCASSPTLGDCPVSARRPFPNFSTFIDSQWGSWSHYNAMNVKFERRTSSMAITAVYTWAKSLDDKSAAAGIGQDNSGGWQGFLNNHDPARDYGPSDFNVGQRFVSSFVYQLPVGHGKRLLSTVSKPVDLLVGGWQITGVATFQQGFPFTVLAGDTTGLLDSFGQNRADKVGSNSGFTKSLNEWFNTSSFVQPGPNQLGNYGRDTITMPGINNWDIGILKDFAFTERLRLQLRLESFNSFNHPQFYPDPTTSAFAGGGTTVGNNVGNPATFGKITGAAPGRIVQIGAKFIF
jgi:hypothetical protein